MHSSSIHSTPIDGKSGVKTKYVNINNIGLEFFTDNAIRVKHIVKQCLPYMYMSTHGKCMLFVSIYRCSKLHLNHIKLKQTYSRPKKLHNRLKY